MSTLINSGVATIVVNLIRLHSVNYYYYYYAVNFTFKTGFIGSYY